MAAPEGRCGFVLEPEEIGVVLGGYPFYNRDIWYEEEEAVCCWRESWEDSESGRCWWHAEVEGKSREERPDISGDLGRLDGAFLRNVDFWNADLSGANLRGADLRAFLYGTNLSEANLRDADLSRAYLRGADLSEANLHYADLSEANLFRAKLQEANLVGTDISGAHLKKANLFKINCSDIEIEDPDDVIVDSKTRISSRIPLRSGFRHRPILSWFSLWDGRARGYEQLRKVFQENGLDDHQRKLYSFRRRARAKEAIRSGRLTSWLGNYLSRILTGHGVMINRVLFWTIFVMFVPWYWYGLVEGWTHEPLEGSPLYYSIVTFVTSPPHPIPDLQGEIDLLLFTVSRQSLSRFIVLLQTYIGTALVILLGYVLSNRDPI